MLARPNVVDDKREDVAVDVRGHLVMNSFCVVKAPSAHYEERGAVAHGIWDAGQEKAAPFGRGRGVDARRDCSNS